MILERIKLLTFSPTRTSLRVGNAIVSGYGAKHSSLIDYSRMEHSAYVPTSDILTIITVPVYGGHVAPLALKRMDGIRGNNSPVVIAVVYGNRDYEEALNQLSDFVTERGFRVIAAGTFIGEHSYSCDSFLIADGRPDIEDIFFAKDFGKAVRKKIEAVNGGEIPIVDVHDIKRPHQSVLSKIGFVVNVLRMRRSKTAMPLVPDVDASLCNHCGACANICPTGAIVIGNELETDKERCIKCCACVKTCPQGARSFISPFAPMLAKYCQSRKPNKTIV